MEEGVGIITKRPQEESNKEYKMFKPLSVMVWIGIAITIIFIGICLCLVNRFSPFSDNTDDEQKDMTNTQIASSSMWLIYGAFVEQGMSAIRTKGDVICLFVIHCLTAFFFNISLKECNIAFVVIIN
jgi:hypothetical protein